MICFLRWELLGIKSLTLMERPKLRNRWQDCSLRWLNPLSHVQAELWILALVSQGRCQTEWFFCLAFTLCCYLVCLVWQIKSSPLIPRMSEQQMLTSHRCAWRSQRKGSVSENQLVAFHLIGVLQQNQMLSLAVWVATPPTPLIFFRHV